MITNAENLHHHIHINIIPLQKLIKIDRILFIQELMKNIRTSTVEVIKNADVHHYQTRQASHIIHLHTVKTTMYYLLIRFDIFVKNL